MSITWWNIERSKVENKLHFYPVKSSLLCKCRRSISMWHVTCDNIPPCAGPGSAGQWPGCRGWPPPEPGWAVMCNHHLHPRRTGLCWGFLSILTMNFNQSHVTSIDKRGSNNWWVARCLILHWESSTAPNGLVEKEPQVMIEFIVLKF